MTRVMLFRRRIFLLQELSDLTKNAMRFSQQLRDLHKYSASIASGPLTLSGMAGMPFLCAGLAATYAMAQCNANGKAIKRASSIFAQGQNNPAAGKEFERTVGFMMDDPQGYELDLARRFPNEDARNAQKMEDSYMYQIFKNAQDEQFNELRKAEEKRLKFIEDEIVQKQELNKSRMETVKAEIDEAKKGESEAVKREAPSYTGLG